MAIFGHLTQNGGPVACLIAMGPLAVLNWIPPKVAAGIAAGAVVVSSLAAFTLTVVKIYTGIKSLLPPPRLGGVVRPTAEEIQKIMEEIRENRATEESRRSFEKLLQQESEAPPDSGAGSKFYCHSFGFFLIVALAWLAWKAFCWLWEVFYSWLT